jgi:hypothetical protein
VHPTRVNEETGSNDEGKITSRSNTGCSKSSSSDILSEVQKAKRETFVRNLQGRGTKRGECKRLMTRELGRRLTVIRVEGDHVPLLVDCRSRHRNGQSIRTRGKIVTDVCVLLRGLLSYRRRSRRRRNRTSPPAHRSAWICWGGPVAAAAFV